ncbi:MAG: hypothetical protein QXD23_00480 [Candidatus Micrarchaeaceae archaeon]
MNKKTKTNKNKLLLLNLFILSFIIFNLSSSSTTKVNYNLETTVSQFQSWFPVISLAVIASFSIIILYYVLGYILNNKNMIGGAKLEFQKILFTIIIVLAVITILNFAGTAEYSTNLISKSSIQTICNQLNNPNTDNSLAFVSSAESVNSPTYNVCSGLINTAGGTNITSNLDYGLGSVYVILSNLTNQAANNLNAIYVYRTYIGFLSNFKATDGLCFPQETCLTGLEGASFSVNYGYNPFAGYNPLITRSTEFVSNQSTLIFYIFIMQLLFTLLLIYGWPYLLAAGLIMSASTITRKAGGFLIAFVIAALIIFPAIYLMEYTAFTSNTLSPIGATSLPSLSLTGKTLNSQKINYDATGANFFVFPNAEYILNNDGCWPHGGLVSQELIIVGAYSVPIYGLVLGIVNAFGSFGSTNALNVIIPFFNCQPANAINSVFDLMNLYGIMSVVGLIFPLLNIFIGITATIGISELLGGTTNILGLNKLL